MAPTKPRVKSHIRTRASGPSGLIVRKMQPTSAKAVCKLARASAISRKFNERASDNFTKSELAARAVADTVRTAIPVSSFLRKDGSVLRDNTRTACRCCEPERELLDRPCWTRGVDSLTMVTLLGRPPPCCLCCCCCSGSLCLPFVILTS